MDFANAPRTTTWVNNTMEGYLKEGGGLWFHWHNVAGHSVSIDDKFCDNLNEILLNW